MPGSVRVGAGHEPALPDGPHGDKLVVVAVADQADGTREVVVEVLATPREAGQSVEDTQVAGMTFDVERVGGDGSLEGGGVAASGRPVVGRATLGVRAMGATFGRADLRRGQEPLEIAQPVAPVAARVDPVVAQAPGIAPRPHRVRMHAEQACRLGHGEGRVGRTGR